MTDPGGLAKLVGKGKFDKGKGSGKGKFSVKKGLRSQCDSGRDAASNDAARSKVPSAEDLDSEDVPSPRRRLEMLRCNPIFVRLAAGVTMAL